MIHQVVVDHNLGCCHSWRRWLPDCCHCRDCCHSRVQLPRVALPRLLSFLAPLAAHLASESLCRCKLLAALPLLVEAPAVEAPVHAALLVEAQVDAALLVEA